MKTSLHAIAKSARRDKQKRFKSLCRMIYNVLQAIWSRIAQQVLFFAIDSFIELNYYIE
jgi:hypothetical protein